MNEQITDDQINSEIKKPEELNYKTFSFISAIFSFFPAFVILIAAGCFLWICFEPGIFSVTALLFVLYAFPLLTYRIHQHFNPLKEGIIYLGGNEYTPWWGSHQIQVIYIAFPALETLLRLIPGAFSFWLRLWGAKVGENVYWTSHLEIADRALIEIGDRVVFGHAVGIYSHIIKPKKQNLMLYVKKVKIGNDVFLGAWNHLGPGVSIQDKTYVPVFTHIYPNKTFK